MRSITMVDNRPSWDYTTCAGCYACVHACPKAAIRFTKYQEPNPEVHYRNPHVTLTDLIKAAG
ncbi:MAG: 4Fe-4S dicluster domain-containing protein [Atopobiaceae bacterium]|nr:4Fe-4S dicluster domain-containing protein [Atopobiaceae bacterium]